MGQPIFSPGKKLTGEILACYTRIELATPGSAVRLASVARHVTNFQVVFELRTTFAHLFS